MMHSLWMLLASLSFAAMGMCVKLAAQFHYSAAEVVFYRNALALLLMVGLVWRKRRQWLTPNWRFQFQRSACGFTAIALYFYAIHLLPLSTAVTLNYTSSLFLAFFLIVSGKQPWKLSVMLALLIGFAGIVLMLHPVFASDLLFGSTIGLASGIFAGMAYYNVRELGELGEPAWRTVLYFAVFSTVCSGLWMLFDRFHPITLMGGITLLCVAVFATLGQLTMTLSYQKGNPMVSASLAYSAVLFAALLGMLVWGDQLDADAWIAMLLIIASGVMTNIFSRGDETNSNKKTSI